MENESTSPPDVSYFIRMVIVKSGFITGIIGGLVRLCEIAFLNKASDDPLFLTVWAVAIFKADFCYSPPPFSPNDPTFEKLLSGLGRKLKLSEKLWFILGTTVADSIILFGIFPTLGLRDLMPYVGLLLFFNLLSLWFAILRWRRAANGAR